MGDVRRGAGAVTGTVLVDTNVFTSRLRERSPLATQYAKHLFGQRRTRNQCRMIGHPLHQSNHNADLWIAATAIRWSIPLVAHDAVFTGCPRIRLLTELDDAAAGSP
jgi:predicted nucleic acid-binding protein